MVNLYADLSPRLYSALQKFVHGEHESSGAAILGAFDRYRTGKALELGCGTGILSKFFKGGEYVGCDFDAARIESAQREHPEHEFLVADATELDPDFVSKFPFVFSHAWVHHVDDDSARRILGRIAGGAAHSTRPIGMMVIEPILPDVPIRNPFGYALGKLDRGRFMRRDGAMRSLLAGFLVEARVVPGPWYWPVAMGYYRLEFPAGRHD